MNINNKVPLTMIELFSGIGSQIKGTNNTGLFETVVVATSDIDKDANVHYETRNKVARIIRQNFCDE